MNLNGSSGQRYQTEAKAFSSGGEGDIFDIIGVRDKVIKIYHSGRATSELEEKLKIMVKRPPSSTVLSQVAWPLDTVYDDRGKFCGFVMPKLSITANLNEIYTYPPRTNISYKQKLILAQNICVVISEVHRAGYVFGDFNPHNIGINTNTGAVAFLDTDSYHIINGGRTYRCKVCMDGYVAPELIRKCEAYKKDAYASAPLPTFTRETDNFALAIHIFKLLMNGFSPFNGIKETESASTASPGVGNQAIKRDAYCFKPGNKPLSAAVPPLDVLPSEIADLFTRAFMYGKDDPKERPSAVEWYKALGNYESSLVQCPRDEAHLYKWGLSTCPWCEADERYRTATAPQLKPKSFTSPVQPNPTPSVSHSHSGTVVPPPQYRASAATGYNKPVITPVQKQPATTSKPARAIIDQRKKTIKTLFKISRYVFIAYTVLMNYFIWFNRTYLYNEMNLLFATTAYLVIIGAWAYLGGLSDSESTSPLIPSLLLYVGLFSSSTGTVILENDYYRNMVNGTFESIMLDLLGSSDFFVIKYMGLSTLACVVFTLIPSWMGKYNKKIMLIP